MITKLYRLIPLGYALITPLMVAAQTSLGDPQEIEGRVTDVQGTLNVVIGALFVLATLIFLWGIVKYVASRGDEKAQASAKSIMLWGVIGLAVMASVWGIANILINYFGTDTGNVIPIGPQQEGTFQSR